MKIGINGRFLAAKRTGVQRAAYNLVRSLVEIDQANQYFLFTSEDQLDNPDWKRPHVTIVPSRIKEGENIKNHIWEQIALPFLAAKYRVDLLHSPANLAPLFYKGRSVIHIHDLCFVVNPQWFSFSFRTLYNFVIPRLAKRAIKVITNSNNSRNDLLQYCNLSADRVSQIYWAVDELFLESNIEPLQPILNEPYILYVGSLEPRKNIGALLEAYEILRTRHPHLTPKLVLIGGESPLFAEVRLKIKKYKEDILFKGFVNDAQLRNYYRGARLFVYPSLYEGFGLPPLEAMAAGVPVVTSMTSSIPEVVGQAALMVSPHHAGQIADAMAQILDDPELAASLVRAGRQQVQKFNWYRVARNTLAIYYEIYHSSRDGDEKRRFLSFEEWKRLKALEDSHLSRLNAAVSSNH